MSGLEKKEETASRHPSSAAVTLHENDTQDEHPAVIKGRIAGGTYLKGLDEEQNVEKTNGPLKQVDFDLPLTITENKVHDGKEMILLEFAPGDPENPFNWPVGRKLFITALLCGMTLFVGLATTAYSSGINSMVAEFGVSNELGQMGLFLFNFVCALAPLILAPFCELVGRRIIYIGAYGCFTIMFVSTLYVVTFSLISHKFRSVLP